MPPRVATRGRGQLGAGTCSMGAARCSTMTRVVLLGGNSWREQPDVAGCRQGRQRAGGCHMDAAGCRRVQEDAAGPLRGGSSLGYSGVQPGVAERGQGQLGAARCSQVQQGMARPAGCGAVQTGAAVCRQVRHGCNRVQPGAAGCSRSLSTRKKPGLQWGAAGRGGDSQGVARGCCSRCGDDSRAQP